MTPPATCILTGTIESPPGTPVVGALVRIRTIAVQLLNNGAGSVVNDLSTHTASDGTFALTVARGLKAQLDIDEVGIVADIDVPDLATVDLSTLVLYARGSLTPMTIVGAQGPSAGGDLTGTFPSPSVIGLRDVPLYPETPSDGDVWVYRSVDGAFRLEPFPVTAAVQSVAAGQGIDVTGPTTSPTVSVANGGIVAAMLATGAAAGNVGALGGVLTGTLPSPGLAADAVADAHVIAGANIAWSKISKVGAVPSDVGAVGASNVIAAVNASAETPKISSTQLQDIPESKVTDLVADLAAKRNVADPIPQADVTGLVAALAAKEDDANKGVPGGYASLDGTGKVPASQLPPSLVDDGDKGDIIVSGSGAIWTIDSKAVTYAKMQDVSAPDRVLGSIIAGSPVEIPFTAFARSLGDDPDAATARGTLGLGTSATRNVSASGDAAAAEVVKGDDTRLVDPRTPTSHTHLESDIPTLAATLAGKVSTSLVIATSAPLTGGGALTGPLTLAVSNATAGAVGVVQLAGDIGGVATAPTVVAVGGQSAANVAAGAVLANAATSANVGNAIVRRDAGGSAALDVVGNVTGNVSGTAANITGTLAIGNGGTGQTTALAAFDALSPTSAKGDLIGHDGAQSVRVAVGADGTVPIADSTQVAGFRWGALGGVGTVTSVVTGNGLQGGPITSSGTIDLRLAAAGGLSKTLGGGLNELGIAAGGVADAMLANPKVSAARAVNTTLPLTGGGDLSADRTLGVNGATLIARGVVMLSGDLGGTADAPTVEQIGGYSAGEVADAVLGVSAATHLNTPLAIVKRDAGGNIYVGAVFGNANGAQGYFTDFECDNLLVNGDAYAQRFLGVVRDTGGAVYDAVAYGADPTGAVDCAGAVAAAIAAMGASGKRLYFPAGTFKMPSLTGSLTGLTIEGAGPATTILLTSVAGDGLVLNGTNVTLRNLNIAVSGTPVDGQRSLVLSGTNFNVENVGLTNWYRGVVITGSGRVNGVDLTAPVSGAMHGCLAQTGARARVHKLRVGQRGAAVGSFWGIAATDLASSDAVTFTECESWVSTGFTAFDVQGAQNVTTDLCTFVTAPGSGGNGISLYNAYIDMYRTRAWGGRNALNGFGQGIIRATHCVFKNEDTSVATAARDSVEFMLDGMVFFNDVEVGNAGASCSCVTFGLGSEIVYWDGGLLHASSGTPACAYGIMWVGDKPFIRNVNTEGTFTILPFRGDSGAQGSVASAASITLAGPVTRVTGTNAISNIAPPAHTGVHVLIPEGAFSLVAGSYITTSMTATVGVPIFLLWDTLNSKWCPTVTPGGSAYTANRLLVGGGTNVIAASSFLYSDPTAERLGVGESTPIGTLHVTQDGSGTIDPTIYADSYVSGFVSGPMVRLRHARGIKGAATQTLAGDPIGEFSMAGYYTGSFSGPTASIVAVAAENVTSTNRGTYLEMRTTAIGASAPVARVRIADDGKVGLGTTSPQAQLDVVGSLALRVEAKTLSSGLNSNISITNASWIRITGPAGAFSIGGFTNGANGKILRVYNSTAQAMTIVNRDASSSAANRISTLTGANVVLRTGTSAATFVYDGAAGLWILMATN